jgi:hypothetical protein
MRISIAILRECLLVTIAAVAAGQTQDMPGMQMPGMQMPGMTTMNGAEALLMSQASGTSMNPRSWPIPMRMISARGWSLMLMGTAFLVDTQQSGPREHDKLYSANWFMFGAAHAVGRGSFMFQLMTSLEPATITNRSYPELFQTGETAYGKPLVDAQHPHNLIMGLGFGYAYPVGEDTFVQMYFAPVGDPALGPVAFPHRDSAAELPEAPLGHHWEDSTHIADEVVTAAIMHKFIRLEASGFYGTEPGENRWIIQHGPINSWSTRLSLFPAKNWMAQVSVGRLDHAEREEPGDVVRSTASLHYSRPMQGSAWSSSLIWGRNHEIFSQHNTDAFTLESALPLSRRNFLTGRVELVDKDELFSDDPALEEQLARTAGSTFRIGAYTMGYTRDVEMLPSIETGIGANFTTYTVPSAITPYYGRRPVGVNVYLRARLRSRK